MSDQRDDAGFADFADWMREREQSRPSDATWPWSRIVDRFGNDGAGLLWVVLQIAGGRWQFKAPTSDVLNLLAMDRTRFNQVVAQLVQAGLIAVRHDGGDDAMEWTILREPRGWAQAQA